MVIAYISMPDGLFQMCMIFYISYDIKYSKCRENSKGTLYVHHSDWMNVNTLPHCLQFFINKTDLSDTYCIISLPVKNQTISFELA